MKNHNNKSKNNVKEHKNKHLDEKRLIKIFSASKSVEIDMAYYYDSGSGKFYGREEYFSLQPSANPGFFFGDGIRQYKGKGTWISFGYNEIVEEIRGIRDKDMRRRYLDLIDSYVKGHKGDR